MSYGSCLAFPRCASPLPPIWTYIVYSDGTLCLDIIQDRWSPIYTVNTILTSIQSLLTDPNASSPANPEAAQLFNTDMDAYKKRVRRCAAKSVEMA